MDAILFWNDIALTAVANDHTGSPAPLEQGGPTRTSRALAIVHVAMFDAFNSIDRSFTQYLVSVPSSRSASKDAAIAQAAFATLAALYPQQLEVFTSKFNDFLASIPPGEDRDEGINIGADVADRILVDRRQDGSQVDMPYIAGILPGQHRPDPLNPNQGFSTPRWGGVKPFALPSVVEFRSEAPPALNSDRYTKDFNDVKANGAQNSTTRTADETEIGIFWAYDGSQGIGTPPRLYNQNVRAIAVQEKNTLKENARLFALANLAMADAGIQCWDTKYFYSFWRPILAVREADAGNSPTGQGDGNVNTVGDPLFVPLGAPNTNAPQGSINFTPNFPSYTSGHATFGAAVFQTLIRFYKRDTISFKLVSDEFNGINRDVDGTVRPMRERTYDSFTEAMLENARSRIYLGIHYQFDADEGVKAGTRIADYVFDNYLKRV
ncbi:phosphatase PAP2 family protein [Scytonema sp. UIC 10036]|uniref:vanadium-dependent haloperoxidase n=1 Tax=Scytonema sp. UIC 10036 TaxID=2304196 RepID=UPI0012DA0858|nr:vanadium-dependent haloperoxidase [Scytonema sp. UIC 10036]MUG95577.1 phosphatase PAP2 family protein [Scytonema sp. UIC 10036]